MIRISLSLLAGVLALGGTDPHVPVSLSGSPASMERQHRVAVRSGYSFVRTPTELRRAIARGELVPVRGGRALAVKHPAESAARPEVKHFLERFAADFRAGCGERLVVTSLARPRSRQPENAHPLSVHPAGLAADLRVPRSARCRRWLEHTLLRWEGDGLLDVTRERSPAHYHLALFPEPYLAHIGLRGPAQPQVTPGPVTVAEPLNLDAARMPRR